MSKLPFDPYFDVTNGSVQIAGDLLHKTSKLCLTLLSQFKIENCFLSIGRGLGLGLGKGRASFFALVRAVHDHVRLQSANLHQLNVPAVIRNSHNSNGIHHGYRGTDNRTTVGQVTYEFCHEQRVTCATFEHVAHALESSITILGEIFATKEVLGLQDPILDMYVW